ncbi:thiamine-binding protein [Candidatus Pacearchaeota archaeon]|nr:MAG: thiamine-binding protein [Candidatus Pacearchaeota archaeon]
MSVLVEYAIFPTDKGESVSQYVSRVIKMLNDSNIEYKLTPMGTIFETITIEEALEIIKKSYEVLEKDCNRIYLVLKMDIRKGRKKGIVQKIKSIEEKIGKVSK